MEHSWGGNALSILTITSGGNPTINTWTFATADRIKPKYTFPPVSKYMRENESGLMRRRLGGYRIRIEIEFENLMNAELIGFLKKLVMAGEAQFYPHPQQLFNLSKLDPISGDYIDYWDVIVESDFDYPFFDDRFIGHKGTIVLVGKDKDLQLPEDRSGGIGGYL
jgi:hypothetical protein